MNREIALISENPEAHETLIGRLEAAGFHPSRWKSLSEAMPRLNSGKISPMAIVYDGNSQGDQLSQLAELDRLHPAIMQLLFYPNPPEAGEENALDQLEGLSGVCVFYRPLTDPNAFRLIEETIAPAPGAPIAPAHSESKSGAGKREAAEAERQAAHFHTEAFLRRVGAANVPVLLHGETGVGKEVMARRLWSYSARAGKPFLKLNCAALPSELIESELFGYEKGAFTGATMDKPGKFELAQNGTILLDEIGDMDIRLQAKLLQVLQDGEVQPLGSSRIISVNVRVMAATHRDLRVAIEQGSFREDLYYRLSVINLTIPPLRARRQEILPLAEQLLLRHLPGGSEPPVVTDGLRQAMLAYSWPGNVRELENVMRRFLVYQDAALLARELVERRPVSAQEPVAAISTALAETEPAGSKIDYLARASREAESKLLLETLEAVRWNRRQAAERLNVEYKAFLYKLQKHGIVEGKATRKEIAP